MKLSRLSARNYRSLRDETVGLDDLNVFIGANASGKSTILDALRFLYEGVQSRDYRNPVFARGGIVHLAWKGEAADQIELVVRLEDEVRIFEWSVRLVRDGYEFYVEERVDELLHGSPPAHLLESRRGEGWWWSGEEGERVELKQPRTSCALAAAAADASFPARDIAEFVRRWGFFESESLPAAPRLGQRGFGPIRPIRPKSGRDALRAVQVGAGGLGGDRRRGRGRSSDFRRKSSLGSPRAASTSYSPNPGLTTVCIRWASPVGRCACWP